MASKPRIIPDLNPKRIAIFWSYVDRSGGPEACWPWTRTRIPAGYGMFAIDGRPFLTHRIAFYLATGTHPNVVRHTCDNRICTNVGHLLGGTQRDNMYDAVTRSRMAHSENHFCHKLTAAQVIEIRCQYAKGVTQERLASEFEISPGIISQLVRGILWSHLVGGPIAQRKVNPLARVTRDQVEHIRARYAAGGITQQALGALYGISGSAVCSIVNHVSWRK